VKGATRGGDVSIRRVRLLVLGFFFAGPGSSSLTSSWSAGECVRDWDFKQWQRSGERARLSVRGSGWTFSQDQVFDEPRVLGGSSSGHPC
jgi:hypothetical protein